MKKLLFALSFLLVSPVCAIPPKDTFVVATRLDDLISLDPAEIFEASGVEYAHNTYDRLVFYSSEEKGMFSGVISKSWDVSEQQLLVPIFPSRK